MLKNDDIYTIVAIGDMNITSGLKKVTSHSLSFEGAYTVSRFKAEVERLAKEYALKYEALPAEAGIEDTKAFDERMKQLQEKTKRTKDENKELEEMTAKLARLYGLRKVLREEEVEVNCKPMSYQDWHNLKQENRGVTVTVYGDGGKEVGEVELFELIEMAAEGVLWKAPEE